MNRIRWVKSMTSKKYLENADRYMKELKSIGLLTQTDLAKYLKVSEI